MKILLPACSVKPKIILEGDSDEEALSIRDIPLNVVVGLFNKIIEVSGLDEKTEEIRKKLETPNLVKA